MCRLLVILYYYYYVNSTYVKLRAQTKFAEQAFSIAGPLAWNALQTELRTIDCKDTFKRRLT